MIKVLKDWYRNLLSDPNSATLFLLITFICVIIYFFTDVLTPLLLALGVSYILEWPINYLEKKKVLSRTVSTSLFMLIFFSLLILGAIMLVPSLIDQVSTLIKKIPTMLDNMQNYVAKKAQEYPTASEYVDYAAVMEQAKSKVAEFSSEFIQNKLLAYLMNLTSFVIYLIIVPLLSFFMLKDKNELLNGMKTFFPSNLDLATKVWAKMNQQLMNYISGKFLHMCIIAGINYVAFKCFDLNYAILLGVAVGISVVIPYVGAVIVTIPVLGIAVSQYGVTSTFWWLVLVYIVIQILDGNVLVPQLFSEKMKLHPFVILSSVLVFGALWGFWGVFFAIPLATLIKTIIMLWPHGEYVQEVKAISSEPQVLNEKEIENKEIEAGAEASNQTK